MAKPLIVTRTVTIFEMTTARVSIISGVFFALLLGSLHLLEPEFDPTWRFISEYMLGSFGWMMTLTFLSLALSLASVGVAVFSQIRTVAGYIGLVVLGLAVTGLLIASAFKTDPIYTKMDDLTDSGKMHVLGASLDYSPLAFLLLSFSLARNQAWNPIRWQLVITAIVTVVVTIGFMLVLPKDNVFGPGVWAGLVGRLLVLSYLGWVGVAAFHAIKLHRQAT
jgi:multisubunit Na+/H+ antiporter MnhC subunit